MSEYRCPYCGALLDDDDATRDGEALYCCECGEHVEFFDALEAAEMGVGFMHGQRVTKSGGKINMQTAETGSEPISGLFDLCGKVQEQLTEAHVIANKLAGPVPVPDNEAAAKDTDTDYLNDLKRKLRMILRDMGNLVERLQDMERRF